MPLVEAAGVFSEHTYEGWLAAPLGLFFDPAQRENLRRGHRRPHDRDLRREGRAALRVRRGLLEAPFAVAVDPREHLTSTCSTRGGRGCGPSATGARRSPTSSSRGSTAARTWALSRSTWTGAGGSTSPRTSSPRCTRTDESRKRRARSGTVGYDRGRVHRVSGITTDAESVYVLDQVGTAVQVLTGAAAICAGGESTRWARKAFSLPSGIAVAPSGKVFVADALRHEVKVFAPGRRVSRTVRPGAGRAPGDFAYPGRARVRLRRGTPRPREAERARAAVPGDRAAVAARAAGARIVHAVGLPVCSRRMPPRLFPHRGSRRASAANAVAPLRCRSSDVRFGSGCLHPAFPRPGCRDHQAAAQRYHAFMGQTVRRTNT